jgi:type I restriction enzyme S subunit
LLAKFWTHGDGGLNQHLFKVTSESHPIWFIACWVWHYLEQFQRIAAAKATTMGHIQREHLAEATVALPSNDQLNMMTRTIAPIFDRQIANDLEIRTLASLRDTLLPKLISGELEAPSLEALGLKAVGDGG